MKKKILVVDDEINIREMLRDAFVDSDYILVEAESAEAALEILKNESIFIVFIDIRLPGMNGLELSRIIRSRYPITCIYSITGYSSVYELADCREAGCDDYFMKPLDLKLVFNTVQESFKKIERWSGHFKS